MHGYQLEAEEEMDAHLYAFVHDFHNVCPSPFGIHTQLIDKSALASAMFAPGVPQLMREFHSSNSVLTSLVVSIYILGNAFGPIVLAPLAGTNRMLSSPICIFLMGSKGN